MMNSRYEINAAGAAKDAGSIIANSIGGRIQNCAVGTIAMNDQLRPAPRPIPREREEPDSHGPHLAVA